MQAPNLNLIENTYCYTLKIWSIDWVRAWQKLSQEWRLFFTLCQVADPIISDGTWPNIQLQLSRSCHSWIFNVDLFFRLRDVFAISNFYWKSCFADLIQLWVGITWGGKFGTTLSYSRPDSLSCKCLVRPSVTGDMFFILQFGLLYLNVIWALFYIIGFQIDQNQR